MIRRFFRNVVRIPAVERLDAAERILEAQLAEEARGGTLTEEEIRSMAAHAGIRLEEPVVLERPRPSGRPIAGVHAGA